MSKPPSGRSRLHDILQPGTVLLGAAVLLPALLFALASWQSYEDALHDAEARVERTVGILHEHAVKVFETNRLVIDQVRERLRVVDWSSEEDRAALHQLQVRLQSELPQIATITVVDREGRMRASGRTYPTDPNVGFAERDWFLALKDTNPPLPYISRAHTGPQSGKQVFNVAGGIRDRTGAFEGVTAVSVDRSYFEEFYRSVDPEFDHNVILVREDGHILAREPSTSVAALTPSGPVMQRIQAAPNGAFRLLSQIDGVERIFSYRKVGDYPVFVGFGISVPAALAPWRRNLIGFGIVATLASLSLLAVSNLAIRQTRREQVARKRWQDTADALLVEASERERIAEQLRQAHKMESVGRLTGGIAHDFNNLLTIVVGSLDLLRRRMPDGDERLARLVSNAIDGANRAAALTHRLLAFSRQQPLDPVTVDANTLVSDMSDLLRRTLGENVAVETVLAEGLWPTFADTNQLESIILNLAVNARDAMPDGGKITIETANKHLDEAYAATHPDVSAGEFVLIAVSDTGTGMTPDVMAKVFEPFFTTKPVGKGTGLGLSQVHGFVKQSGGHVSIRSEVGRGTTISLYLPRLKQPQDKPPIKPQEPQQVLSSAKGETILVVEDEWMVRQFSAAALAEAGYVVLEAADGPAALDLLERHPEVALLFTDVVLAGPMNGRMLADGALALRPKLPVLFTTGYTRDAIIHHGRLDEGVNFLGKPFTTTALAAKIHHLLGAGGPAERRGLAHFGEA